MSIKPYIDKLKEDWAPKIICLVLALFIFLFFQVVSLERSSFVLPLETRDLGLMTSADTLPPSVRLTVRGRAQDISRISEQNFSAYVDFSKYTKEGLQTIPIQLRVDDSLLGIDPLELTLNPDTVQVTLETRLSEYVPVKPVLFGNPRFGYTLGDTAVSPQEVRISGPRSMVSAVPSIETEGVSIEGRSDAFSQGAKLLNTNPFITLDGGDVEVSVRFTAVEITRAFICRPEAVNLAPALSPAGSFPPVEVTLSGAQAVVAALDGKGLTLPIDCGGITGPGDYALPVTVTPPPQTRLESVVPGEITVSIVRRGN
jgi:hypothetical protein